MKKNSVLVIFVVLAGCNAGSLTHLPDAELSSQSTTIGLDFTHLSVTPRSKGELLKVTPRSKGETLNVTPRSKGETLKLRDSYQQIERLGQPLLNQGLILERDQQNHWNQLQPTADNSMAAAAEFGLKAYGKQDSAFINQRLSLLLPDVLRIDTTQLSSFSAQSPGGRAVGGRLIKDDVIDVSLAKFQTLTKAKLGSDNVSYDGPNAFGTRHKPVLKNFPYLAAPN